MKYLWDKGVKIEKGIVDYPKLKVRNEVILRQEDIEILNSIENEVLDIIRSEKVPQKIDSKICKKCAYYEFCYI